MVTSLRLSHFVLTAALGFATVQSPGDGPAAQAEQKPQASKLAGPGKRAPIARIGTLVTRSTVILEEAKDQPLHFEAAYTFPARARWLLSGTSEDSSRLLRYQYGEQAYSVQASSKTSAELLGADRLSLLREIALRRSLFLWPDGLEWKTVGVVRVADIGPAGTLVATFGESDRPVSIGSLDAEGTPIETLGGIEWKRGPRTRPKEEPRYWPARMYLKGPRGIVWREEVTEVVTNAKYVDSYFLPPDRRSQRTRTSIEDDSVQFGDIPGAVVRRVELPTGKGWTETLEWCEQRSTLEAAELKKAKLALDPYTTIELDREARPVALILRLQAAPEHPPKDWLRLPSRPGLSLILPSIERVSAQKIGDLLRAASGVPGSAGAPYARITPAGSPKRLVQLVLPLEERK